MGLQQGLGARTGDKQPRRQELPVHGAAWSRWKGAGGQSRCVLRLRSAMYTRSWLLYMLGALVLLIIASLSTCSSNRCWRKGRGGSGAHGRGNSCGSDTFCKIKK